MKKKYLLYGNCQGRPLEAMLSRSAAFSNRFECAGPIKPVHLLAAEDRDDLFRTIERVDLLIYQNVNGAGDPAFNTDSIERHLKNDCIKIRIPNAYFRGYHPEITYIRALGPRGDRFIPLHDVNIVREYIRDRGACIGKCADAISDRGTYSSRLVEDNYHETMGELRRRESLCDVVISDFIEENWSERRLFYSMNHPTNEVLAKLASRVLNLLGVNDPVDAARMPPLLDLVILPVYGSICEYTDISFNDRVKVGKNHYSILDYVSRVCDVYSDIDVSELEAKLPDLCGTGAGIVTRLIKEAGYEACSARA